MPLFLFGQGIKKEIKVIDSTTVNCPYGYTLLKLEKFSKGSILRDTCTTKDDFPSYIPTISDIYNIENQFKSYKKYYRQYSGIIVKTDTVVVVKYLYKRKIRKYPEWKHKHCIVYPEIPTKKQIVRDIRYFHTNGKEILDTSFLWFNRRQ